MLENKIIKVSDLKIYAWISKIKSNSFNLFMGTLNGILNTPTDYYWVSHRSLLVNIYLYGHDILTSYKDFIVMMDDGSYSLNIGYDFKNGEDLLLYFLKLSFHIWVGLLPIISEIYFAYKEKGILFTELELQYIDLWINILPVIEELINILNKQNSKLMFEPLSAFALVAGVFCIEFLMPKLSSENLYIEILSKDKDKKFLIDNII